MNEVKKLILQRHEKTIFDDVSDVEDIVIHLQSKNILSAQEALSLLNDTKAPAKLLKLLYGKTGGQWFEEFIFALKKEFSWISNKISSDYDASHDERITHYLSGRGSVPPLPQHNVIRNDVNKVREEIRSLKRDSFLVVHGMPGLGKTCLVINALHDIQLLENYLNGCVYWMSVGDVQNDELDDLQCSQLQKKLCDMINLHINPQQDCLLQLRKHFSVKPNISALLVLDKVKSAKVVEVLNVGCKILVTTQNCDVVRSFSRKHFFSIADGFSETESVHLLKEFNGSGDLEPPILDSAMKIHRFWKGHPMVIGLIGGELSGTKADSSKTLSRWKNYEGLGLQGNSERETRRRSLVAEQISPVFKLAIEKIPDNFKIQYKMLAVLVKGTNITTEVLKILWEFNEDEVEKAMDLFYRRSLVFRKFNDKLEMPVYGIHDILADYLKNDISSSDSRNMHKKLILNFYEASHHNFAELPRDNYIYSYLCHHVEHANMWNKFRDQFFSLQYVESKLKATGPGDLLLDLHKYHNGLVGNGNEYQSKVEDIKKLVKDSGWEIDKGEMDVVQCALLQPRESFLYREATQLARKNNPTRLIFNPYNTWERPKDLEVKVPNVKAVCLVNNSAHLIDGRVLLYPDQEGHIVEFDMHYRQNLRSFWKTENATERVPVVMLKMSPLCDRFLSALENGCLSVWNLTSENTSTPPPTLRQRNHQAFHEEIRTVPSLSHKYERRITCASFSSCGNLVLSASENGAVSLWRLEENKSALIKNVHPSPSAIACAFLRGDTIMAYGGNDFKIFLHDWKLSHSYEFEIERNYGDLVTLLGVGDEFRKLIVVQETAVQLYSWETESLNHQKKGPRRTILLNGKLRVLYRGKKATKITCATYHPRHRLLIGTVDGCCLFLDVLSNSPKEPLKFGAGEVKAVDMSESRVVFAQKDIVKMLWLDSISNLSSVKQAVGGHLGWTGDTLSVYTTFTSDGIVQVYHDGKLLGDKLCQDVCLVRVSPKGDHILIGTSAGKVMCFDTISRNLEPLPLQFSSAITYLSVVKYGSSKSMCFAATRTELGLESYTLQAIDYISKGHYIKYALPSGTSVAKAFISSKQHCMIVVLTDYSILAWDLSQNDPPAFFLHEGRETAFITDASLSKEEDVLVMSDKEHCFHQVDLKWPQDEGGAQDVNIHSANYKRPHYLNLNLDQDSDEVDGFGMSQAQKEPVKGFLTTHQLQNASWCCCICPRGNLAAIGHDDYEVLVWGLKTKRPIVNFDVLPNRRVKVGQLQFSPYSIELGGNVYQLILCVVTDCLSLWDLSPLIPDNADHNLDTRFLPKCLGCVSAAGNPIIELSINQYFDKFCLFDEFGSYFYWNMWKNGTENECRDF